MPFAADFMNQRGRTMAVRTAFRTRYCERDKSLACRLVAENSLYHFLKGVGSLERGACASDRSQIAEDRSRMSRPLWIRRHQSQQGGSNLRVCKLLVSPLSTTRQLSVSTQ